MREEPPVCFADSPLLRKGAARGAGRRGVGPYDVNVKCGPPRAAAPTGQTRGAGRGKPRPYDVNTEFGMKAAAPERSGGFLRCGMV